MIIENCSKQENSSSSFAEEIDNTYSKKVARVSTENTVYKFPKGLPAFEDCHNFSLLVNDNIKPFLYLKSLDRDGLGFICIDPFLVKNDYNVDLSAKDVSLLELKDTTDVMILTFVTVNEDPTLTTTNLLAPVVINTEKKLGQQIILSDSGNEVKYKIWSGLEG
ncbi:flagellar assembly protein FliW [Lentisphaerota bacterium WC36G]|nr:flagellar assembly protein FliW [Lentisphaerae bacterium WC36]